MELPFLALAPLLPVLAVQGRQVRRTVPRLPEAVDTAGWVGAGSGVHVMVVGDSVAAGVGVDSHRNTLAGRLAARLAGAGGATWRVLAQTGRTAGGARVLVGDGTALATADVVVVSVGVNDVLGLSTTQRWRRELTELLTCLREAAPKASVVLIGLPPIDMFPSLPEPTRSILAARARRLDRVGRRVASDIGVARVELTGMSGVLHEAFAADGFHPSAQGHAQLADEIVGILERRR